MTFAAHQLFSEDCRKVSKVLARVGDKWSMLIIVLLRDGARRFNGMRRTVDGISQQMLTRTLRGLERDGMVTRTMIPASPPQVEYLVDLISCQRHRFARHSAPNFSALAYLGFQRPPAKNA